MVAVPLAVRISPPASWLATLAVPPVTVNCTLTLFVLGAVRVIGTWKAVLPELPSTDEKSLTFTAGCGGGGVGGDVVNATKTPPVVLAWKKLTLVRLAVIWTTCPE